MFRSGNFHLWDYLEEREEGELYCELFCTLGANLKSASPSNCRICSRTFCSQSISSPVTMAAMAEKATPEYDSDEEIFPQSTQEIEGEEAVAEVEEDTSVNNPDAIAKYQESATICQQVIQSVADSCIVGASVHDICKGGDDMIVNLTKNLYKNKVKGRVVEKGVAFPVCVSVNDCVAHMSPLTSEEPVSTTHPYSIPPCCLRSADLFVVLVSFFFDAGFGNGARDRRPLPSGTAGWL